VTEVVVLGAPDHELAEDGEKIFTQKCSACHKMGEKYVGPPLGGIVDRLGPTFVMNMALNPEEMYTRHPDVKKLLGEYMTQMPNQQLTQPDARAIVEYLRTQPASGS
jgi:mono/diheme cytochrome c family protein